MAMGGFAAALAVVFFAPAWAFPQKKDITNNMVPEYYDSFSNSLGYGVKVFDLEELATFDGNGYQSMAKGAWWYYPPYNYMALEGLPGLDWVSGYRADWYFEFKKQDSRASMLVSNLWHNWTSKKVTYFSPLTVSKIQLPGLKANFASKKVELTGIYSWVDPMEPTGDARPSGESSQLTVRRARGVSVIGGEAGLKKIGVKDVFNIDLGYNFAKVYNESPYLNELSSATLEIGGPAIQGDIKGIKFKTEYSVSKKSLGQGTTNSYALYMEAKKTFMDGNLIAGGENYVIQPDFSTSYEGTSGRFNLVDDNDDNDKWVDSNTSGQLAGWLDTTYPANQWMWNPVSNSNSLPLTMFFFLYDRDGSGNYDWNKVNLFYAAEHPFLWDGDDRNNNWVPDKNEDDTLPDYKYNDYSLRRDLRGSYVYLTYKLKDLNNYVNLDTDGNSYWLIAPLQVTIANLDESMLSDQSNKYNKAQSLALSYTQRFDKILQLNIDYLSKRVKDTYPHDLVTYGTFSGPDQLDFVDSVYNTLSVKLNYSPAKNFKIENKMVTRTDNKLIDDIIKNRQGMSTRVEYNFKLPENWWDKYGIMEKMTVEPKYKYLATSQFDGSATDESYGNNLMLALAYEPFDNMTFRVGKNYLWLRDTDKTQESDADLNAYELAFKQNAAGYNFVFYGGYNRLKSVIPTTGATSRDEDLYFVRIFVK
jgi:hypothetical protein